MIRKLKRACGIHFSTKALVRNPGVHLRQMTRRHRSFRGLLDELADERQIAVVQVGANDGRDALGNLIRSRPDRIERALLIEPQRAAFDRLTRRFENLPQVIRLNVAIDRQPGQRKIYFAIGDAADRLGDGIASFERRHVEKEIRAGTDAGADREVAALIGSATVPVATLEDTTAEAGIVRPDVLMVDTEGFDGEIVRMALEAGWLPAVIRYEHKHLTGEERRTLARDLAGRGYRLWADQADVWGYRAARTTEAAPGPRDSRIQQPLRGELSSPSDGRPLVLSRLEPFAKGHKRHCYVHPDDADLCVKVVARTGDARCDTEQRQDIEDYAWLERHRPEAIFERIPAFEGIVETDLGAGIVMRLYRDEDGRISRNLTELVREHGLTPALDRAIGDLKRWQRKYRLLTRDTGPHNIVAIRLGGGFKLAIIEDWLNRRHRWLARLHPVLTDFLIEREMRKFDRRLAKLTGRAANGTRKRP